MRERLACLAMMLGSFLPVSAQEPSVGVSVPAHFRAELDERMGDIELRLLTVLGAIPTARLAWKPSSKSTSFEEELNRVDAGHRVVLRAIGVESAERGQGTGKKGKGAIAAALRESFGLVREILHKLPDGALEKRVTIRGKEMTVRSALLSLAIADAESLGQVTAYARMVGK